MKCNINGSECSECKLVCKSKKGDKKIKIEIIRKPVDVDKLLENKITNILSEHTITGKTSLSRNAIEIKDICNRTIGGIESIKIFHYDHLLVQIIADQIGSNKFFTIDTSSSRGNPILSADVIKALRETLDMIEKEIE